MLRDELRGPREPRQRIADLHPYEVLELARLYRNLEIVPRSRCSSPLAATQLGIELPAKIAEPVCRGRRCRASPGSRPRRQHLRPTSAGSALLDYHETLEQTKRDLIVRAFERAGHNDAAAARLLGVHPNYLHRLPSNLNLRQRVGYRSSA